MLRMWNPTFQEGLTYQNTKKYYNCQQVEHRSSHYKADLVCSTEAILMFFQRKLETTPKREHLYM